MPDFWTTTGIAALISLVVSGTVTIWTGIRKIHQEAVIEERSRWRNEIRALIPKLLDPAHRDIRRVTRNEIFLRLNPTEDREAMQLIDRYVESPSDTTAEKVVEHFQRYLKFEWTRAKNEAGWLPFRTDVRARREISAQERRASNKYNRENTHE